MIWFVLLLNTCVLSASPELDNLVVNIEEGALRGTSLTSLRNNRIFYAFLGIPYAEPPVGELRFQAPRPVRPWNGILDATREKNVCPQITVTTNNTYMGDEDCLNLHVFTSVIPGSSNALKPVLVWFHQGAFLWHSGNRENAAPDFFMKEDIIFVAPNSRLGPLGYLSLQTPEVPGNAGLKDQSLSLQWIHKNIHKFGGDPGKITILGESAGGNNVHFHMLSPMSKGLFHGAIASSGTALRPWYYKYPYCNTQYIQDLGLNFNDPEAALQRLMNMSAFELVKPVPNPSNDPTIRVPFCPTIDIASPSGEVFLPDTPLNIMKQGNFHKVPFLIGMNNADGIKYAEALETILNEDTEDYLESVISPDFNIQRNSPEAKQIVKDIVKFYFDTANSNETKLLTYIRYVTDVCFFIPLFQTLKLHFDGQVPLFAYQFSVDGNKYLFSKERKGLKGASHGDEMPYLFASTIHTDFEPGSVEYNISERLIKMWSNFVKTGNPTPEADPLLQNVWWEPFDLVNFPYLDINTDLSLQHSMKKEILEFWKEIYRSYDTTM